MTKREIADVLNIDFSLINRAFRAAENDCESLKKKNSTYNKKRAVDYTWEEFQYVCKYLYESNHFQFTAALKVYLKDHWIERDVPYKYNNCNKPYSYDAVVFIRQYERGEAPDACINCIYHSPRVSTGTLQKGAPYCSFYDCQIRKVKGKRNVYKDRCMTYRRSKNVPYIYTNFGPVLITNLDKLNTTMAGIPQSEFKSKREKDEPIYILRDVFAQ